MKCEVRNVQSSEVFQIPPEGMIFGRAGGPANITVSDQSVSKRHARIYEKDGQWFLEDLKSVNGTVVNNRRITEPMQLAPGFIFALSKHQFEVVSIDGANPSPATRSSRSGGGMGGESDPRRGGRAAMQPAGGAKPRSPPTPSGQPVQVPDPEPLLPPERSRSMAAPPPSRDYDEPGRSLDEPYEDDGEGDGPAAVLAALPRAVAYYLAAIPLMALNPIGTIKKGVEEPRLKAMGRLELIAFSLPVQLFAALVVPIATGIGTLVGGGGFSFGAFFPIVSLVIAVVVSVVSGLVWHPLCTFVIDRLFKGESNELTRTNYMVMFQTAQGLIAVPAALTGLLTPVVARLSASFSPAAILFLIPALLTIVTMPLIPYLSWQWMKRFNVIPIIQKIAFVLVILSLLGGVGMAAGTIATIVRTIASGGGAVATSVDTSDGAARDGAAKDGDAKDGDAKDAAATDGDAKDGDAKDGAAKDGAATEGDGKKPVEVDPPKDDKPTAVDPPRDDPPEAAAGGPKGSYLEYKRKRDFIEKTLSDNPALLVENPRVGRLYQELSRQTVAAIEAANEEVPKRERSELRYFLEKYREAFVFKKTDKIVDDLYKVLNKK